MNPLAPAGLLLAAWFAAATIGALAGIAGFLMIALVLS